MTRTLAALLTATVLLFYVGCQPAQPPGQPPTETSEPAPAETPTETPAEAPEQMPTETPEQAPAEAPEETPAPTPDEPSGETLRESPEEVLEVMPPEPPAEDQETVSETAIPPTPDVEVPPAETKSVAFAVAWHTDEDPATAAQTAAASAIAGLGCPAKGLVFYEYFPVTVQDDQSKDKEMSDAEKEKAVLPALRSVADSVPVIGCRARSLVTGGTMDQDTVAVLAIGGDAISCKVVKAPLVDDRKLVGTSIAAQLDTIEDLKLVLALSEMPLSFVTKEGVSVDDFIRGMLATAGEDVVLFGGNCRPNDQPAGDLGGVQFFNDQMLDGHVVAMGIGGPIAVHANHTDEFIPSERTVTVTKAEGTWIHEFDGRPAAEVYREIRGMTPDDPFTIDWQHPIGVVVAEDEVYLRMVLEENTETGSLRFVAAVPEGTKVKILSGGDSAQAILDTAGEAIAESLSEAGDAEPLVALLSDCCCRRMRLREFRQGSECEIKGAILPAMGDSPFPVFGFYAWGELGPIAGPFDGLNCVYQQHTLVSAVLTEVK